MNGALARKIERHDAFWKRAPVERPLLSYTTADRFPYDKMRASRALMQPNLTITPDMVDVDAFVEQTAEQLAFRAESPLPNDFIAGVSPFGGIPWMECLLGCGVLAMEHSFVSTPCMAGTGDPDALRLNEEGAWYRKYLEFLTKYEERFGDAYPVTETLMRGCLDVYGALIGQEEMVYAFYDEPDTVARMLDRINRAYVEMVKLTLRHSRRVAGGYLHPYGLWSPGTVNQFQEDLCALITPDQMRRFVVPLHERMCAQFSINGMHTHPTSYHVFPEQLGVQGLHLVQAQKDEGDPPIFDRIPVLQSVQKVGKCLHFTADLTYDEVDALLEGLSMRGLSLGIRVERLEEALEMHEYILSRCAARGDR